MAKTAFPILAGMNIHASTDSKFNDIAVLKTASCSMFLHLRPGGGVECPM